MSDQPEVEILTPQTPNAPEIPKAPEISNEPILPAVKQAPVLPAIKDPLSQRPAWNNRFGAELNIKQTEAHPYFKKYFGKQSNETPYTRYRQMHLETTAAVSLAKKMMLEGSAMEDIQEALTKRRLNRPNVLETVRGHNRYQSVVPRDRSQTSDLNSPKTVKEMKFLIPKPKHNITERESSPERFRSNPRYDRHRAHASYLYTKPTVSALGSY